MAIPVPPDNERCTHITSGGNRCSSYRLPGDESQTLCFAHFSAADAKRYPHDIVNLTAEILSPRDRFDTPRGVNRVLARVMRLLAEGRISSRDALALGYIGQLIVNTLPHIARESARKAARAQEAPAMGAEALAGFQAVLQSLQEPAPAPAPTNSHFSVLKSPLEHSASSELAPSGVEGVNNFDSGEKP